MFGWGGRPIADFARRSHTGSSPWDTHPPGERRMRPWSVCHGSPCWRRYGVPAGPSWTLRVGDGWTVGAGEGWAPHSELKSHRRLPGFRGASWAGRLSGTSRPLVSFRSVRLLGCGCLWGVVHRLGQAGAGVPWRCPVRYPYRRHCMRIKVRRGRLLRCLNSSSVGKPARRLHWRPRVDSVLWVGRSKKGSRSSTTP